MGKRYTRRSKRRRSVRSKTRRLATNFHFYLLDECWESIFKFIIHDEDDKYNRMCYLNSLSRVSKQFLSITDRLRYSLTFCYSTRLFQRFTNLVSLNLEDFGGNINFCGNINALLEEISCFPMNLTSLNISHQPIPVDGLRAFSQNITTLTSLTWSRAKSIETVMFLIAECFPLLEELDLSEPIIKSENYECLCNSVKALSSKLFKLRKVNLTKHIYINDESLFHLFKNWKFLEEAIILDCGQITNAGVASALLERPTLRSLSFNNTIERADNATFFALVNNSPSLSEISLRYTWKNCAENSNPMMDVVVIPQMTSLCLENNYLLNDERIRIFVSLFPNLQRLNLSYCYSISEEGICQVLKICRMIIHLNLRSCSQLKLLWLNFEVPKLEVLNLSGTKVDDKTLYVISKHCRGLLQLLLIACYDVTEKGVKQVIEKCTQLREINLSACVNVDANVVVASMVVSRPSWREIITPSTIKSSGKKKFFLREGFPFTKCLIIIL